MAFDNRYEMAIVLTKGTKPLAEQTLMRLREDFADFVEENKVQIHDIMDFPDNMVPYELNQKIVIVVKKEVNNLGRLRELVTSTYPALKSKKTLIIDDEADFASVNFHKEKASDKIEQ